MIITIIIMGGIFATAVVVCMCIYACQKEEHAHILAMKREEYDHKMLQERG